MMKPFAAWAAVKSHESGWRRLCSDTAVFSVAPDEKITYRQCIAIGQPAQRNGCVLSASCVDDECRQLEVPLEWSLQHIRVLDPSIVARTFPSAKRCPVEWSTRARRRDIGSVGIEHPARQNSRLPPRL